MALLQEAQELKDGAPGIVTIVESVIALLGDAGLSWKMQIPSNRVGVHSTNRYGFGVSWARFHRLGKQIVHLGFSWQACSMIVCMEDDTSFKHAEFTVQMQNKAAQFGKQNKAEIKHGRRHSTSSKLHRH